MARGSLILQSCRSMGNNPAGAVKVEQINDSGEIAHETRSIEANFNK
jgi:hypothetical protein